MTTPKHPTRVIYHHDPASLPAELHAQYEVRQAPRVDTVRGPTIVIDDGGPSIITDGPSERPPSVLLTDTVFGDVGPGVIPLPVPLPPVDESDSLDDLHDAIDAYAMARIERSRDCATDVDVANALAIVDEAIARHGRQTNRPGRLVRDDAACGWRFEPAVRDE